MKKYLIFLSFLLSTQLIWGQITSTNKNAYLWQDVFSLNDLLVSPQVEAKSKIVKILHPRYFPGSKYSNYDSIYKKAQNNPFLKLVLPENVSATLTEGALTPSIPLVAQSGELGKFIDPIVVLDALGRLVQRRIVDELNLAYLNRLRDFLDQEESISILLPKTHRILASLGTSYSFQYKGFLTTLRKACLEDMTDLPHSMENYVRAKKINGLTNDEYVLILAVLKTLGGTRNFPEDIIADLGAYDYGLPNNVHSNVEFTLKTTALISNRLRLHDPVGPWLSNDDRSKFLKNPDILILFLGLIYEADKDALDSIIGSDGTSLYKKLKEDKVVDIVKQIHQILLLIGDVDALLKKRDLKKLNEKTDLLHFDLQLIERIFKSQIDRVDTSKEHKGQYKTLLKEVLEVKYQFDQKRYASALAKAYAVICCQLAEPCDEPSGLMLYAEFFDAIMREDNPDSLAHILSAFAAPVGSYSIKRRAPFSVSLSSFPGAIGGNEKLLGKNTMQMNTNKVNSFAFTAPFGLALSKAIAVKDTRGGHSITGFFPLVDVAAITAFRFEDGTAELPKITWKNFFAPGAYLIWGIRQSPVSINAGFLYGPELREIELNKVLELIPSRRAVIGLTLDLHLFNLSHQLPPFQNK